MWRSVLLFVALALAAPVDGYAEDHAPEVRRAAIFLRALAFDRNLGARAGTRVVLAVVVARGRAQEPELAVFLGALRDLQKLTVKALPFEVVTLEATDAATLEKALAEAHASALLVGPGLAAQVPELLEVTRRRKALSMAWGPEELAKGVCLGVAFEGPRPRIQVSLPSCAAEGVAFESQMLDLAKVTR